MACKDFKTRIQFQSAKITFCLSNTHCPLLLKLCFTPKHADEVKNSCQAAYGPNKLH